jgi:replicative DNA helicase
MVCKGKIMNESHIIVLAAMWADPGIADQLEITGSMLEDGELIYHALRANQKMGLEPGDMIAVKDRIEEAGLWSMDIRTTLASIQDRSHIAIPMASYHAERIREATRKRMLEIALKTGLETLQDRSQSAAEIVEATESRLSEALRAAPSTEKPLGPEYNVELTRRVTEHRAKRNLGVKTGIPALDSIVRGLQPGQFCAIGARPGKGKSALLCQIAARAAAEGIGASIISLEMSRAELLDRIVSARSTPGRPLPPAWMIRGGAMNDSELAAVREEVARISGQPLRIIDGPHTPDLLRSRIRREAARGAGLVAIDYLGLVSLLPDSRVPRWQQIGALSKELHLLATSLKIVIVVAVQLTRSAQSTEPTLADLRDSGDIEQDADTVILLHAKEDQKPGELRQIDAIVAKSRFGQEGRTAIYFDGLHTRFIQEGN